MPEWGNGKGVIFVKGPAQMWKFLPMMSSHTLILCGEKPGSALPEMREVWKERIGSYKMFGRRGMEKKVDVETVEGTGHLLPMEKPGVCAERAASWIKEELTVLEASMKRLEAEPVVKDVFKSIDLLRIKEVQKALNMLGDLDDNKKKIIDELSKAIVESIVTTPMNNLRKHTEQGNTELLDAVEKLFEYKTNT